ncbi:hypothetical protein Tco_0490449 [Tanacetum coccineum]
MKLNARCSVVLQNELPLKEKDPGSFVLPCVIGNTTVSNALANLGASISVMPFSMIKRLEVGKEQVIFNANEGATPIIVSTICVIQNFDVIDDIDGPDDLEKFLMNDNLKGDLGNFLQDNNLFPNYETNSPFPDKSLREIWSPTKRFQDSDNDFGSRIDELVAIDDLWGDLDSGALNSKQPLRPEFHSIGNRVNRYNPYNLQITCKIGFVNFNPYIDPISPFNVMSRAAYNSIMKQELTYTGNNIVGKAKNLQVFIGCHSFLTNFIILENMNEFVEKGLTEVIFGKPFKEKIGLEEDISKGRIWFKIGDDKTIFNMPRAEKRLSKLTTEQQNMMMPPILKISDENKAKGIITHYLKIKEFIKHAWPEGITPQDCIIYAATQSEIALSQSQPVESQEQEPRQQQPMRTSERIAHMMFNKP